MILGELTAGVLNVEHEESRKTLESSLGWTNSDGDVVTEVQCPLVWSLRRLMEATNARGSEVAGDSLYRVRSRFVTRPGGESLEEESTDGRQ